MNALKSLTIRGFRSIASLENFEPGMLCVLIGPNGAGKSNFIEFFRMLRAMADEAFQTYALETGPEAIFHMGPKRTPKMSARLEFGENLYEFDLSPVHGGGVLIAQERVQHTGDERKGASDVIAQGRLESMLNIRHLPASTSRSAMPTYDVRVALQRAVSSWTVYHVLDTGPLAPLRSWGSVTNYERLGPEARNLAAVLFYLREKTPSRYTSILETIRLTAPFIDDFIFRPEIRGRERQVRLEWKQHGLQEPFQPTLLSDGTIRFIALVTALLQPDPPSTIVIDEPELGLHPYAINLLAETIRATVNRGVQVILATQSPQLIDCFEPADIVVVERSNGHSTFTRLDADKLAEWLRDYSLGELWLKNILGGRPGRD